MIWTCDTWNAKLSAVLAYLHDVARGAATRSLCVDDVRAIATLNPNIGYASLAAVIDRWSAREGR
jgi:hypothetical protein